jgi:hypothetical protein
VSCFQQFRWAADDAGVGDSTLRTKFLERRRHDFLLLLHQLLTSPSPISIPF